MARLFALGAILLVMLLGIGAGLAPIFTTSEPDRPRREIVAISRIASTLETPVPVQIGDWRLAIPAAYFDAPLQKDSREEEFLTEDGFHRVGGVFMITELPDLTARTKDSYEEWRKHRGYKESRWINVLLNREPGRAGPLTRCFEIFSGTSFSNAQFAKVARCTALLAGSRSCAERQLRQIRERRADGLYHLQPDRQRALSRMSALHPSSSCSQCAGQLWPSVPASLAGNREQDPRPN